MTRIQIPYGWKPRKYQEAFWEARKAGIKRSALAWHRRSGKDDVCLHTCAVEAHKRTGSYWHMLPMKEQARTALWDAVNPHTGLRRVIGAFPEILGQHKKHVMTVEFKCGSNWSIKGSDNFDALVGSTPIGLIFSEYALANPMAWSLLQPMLLENGGFAHFISTPRGKNHFYNLFKNNKNNPNWFVQKLTVDDTGLFSQKQLDEAYSDLYAQYSDETIADGLFQQEYYCSFDAAILGAVYAKQINKAEQEYRIVQGEPLFNPNFEVHTAWDLGLSDPTSIWFYQIVGGEIRFIDYFEQSHGDLPSLVKVLIEKANLHGYHYAERHNLPHDGLHKVLAAGGRSIVEQLEKDFGLKCNVLSSTTLANTIAAGRKTIGAAYFCGTRCEDAIELLRSYRFKWDDKLKRMSSKPIHDYTSHCADALGIASRAWRADPVEAVSKREKGQMSLVNLHFAGSRTEERI